MYSPLYVQYGNNYHTHKYDNWGQVSPGILSTFPLEQSSVFVQIRPHHLEPGSTLHTPHSRAALSLSKARLIAASYNDSNAKVGCLSNSAPNTEVGWCRDEYQRGIIVEIYRVFVRLLF